MRETLATRREEVRLCLFALASREIAHRTCREPRRRETSQGGDGGRVHVDTRSRRASVSGVSSARIVTSPKSSDSTSTY